MTIPKAFHHCSHMRVQVLMPAPLLIPMSPKDPDRGSDRRAVNVRRTAVATRVHDGLQQVGLNLGRTSEGRPDRIENCPRVVQGGSLGEVADLDSSTPLGDVKGSPSVCQRVHHCTVEDGAVPNDLQDAMVEAIGSLVRIESPTSDVAACSRVADATAGLITDWLGDPALVIDHGGRPVVRWGPEQPAVLLLGHLDTVWPIGSLDRLPWRVEDEHMRGPGVFDMKTGVVMAIAATQLLTDASDVGLLFTSDEETGSATSRDLIADSISRARAVLVFEPAAREAYKTRRKGTSWYRVAFEGRAAHAGLEPEAGINALLEAALFATDAVTWANPAQGTTVTPTLLHAGTTANTVPDRAELTMDVRAWNRDEQERVDEAVRSWRLWQEGAGYQVAGGIDRPALEAEASEMLYALAVQCAQDLGYPEPPSAAVGGASDGNLTAAAGVPTLDGMGACGDGAHADHEWASVAALVPRTTIAAELIRRLLS